MADDGTGADDTQAVSDAQNPDTDDQQTQSTDSQDQTSTDDVFDKARAEALIRKLRPFEKQAKDAQKRLAEFERREQEAETARLSKEEQLTKQLQQRDAELESEKKQHRDRQNHYELQLQASRQGVVDPEAAAKLLDWGTVDYDDDGKPTNLDQALADLLEQKPWLKAAPVQQQRTSGSPTNPATRTAPEDQRTYSAAEISDHAFYVANKDAIMRAAREGRITE